MFVSAVGGTVATVTAFGTLISTPSVTVGALVGPVRCNVICSLFVVFVFVVMVDSFDC